MNEDTIEFVSYDGKYPALCMGTLVLRINGKEVSFGHESGCDHLRFFGSGGNCSLSAEWDEMVTSGPWEYYDCDSTPEEIKRNKDKVMEMINEHIPQGCCGGCI